MILLFRHIVVLHNHTKTHRFIFYLILVLKILNRLVFSLTSVLFFLFISIANRFSVKNFHIFLLCQFYYLCFLTFSIVFPKTALHINLKKSLPKSFFAFLLRFVFILIYDFNQAFGLNLIILCKFFKNNP